MRAEAKRARRENDERRSTLIDALARKAGALLDLAELSVPVVTGGTSTGSQGTSTGAGSAADAAAGAAAAAAAGGAASASASASGGAGDADALAACMAELRKWTDTGSDAAHLMLHARAEARAGRWVRYQVS